MKSLMKQAVAFAVVFAVLTSFSPVQGADKLESSFQGTNASAVNWNELSEDEFILMLMILEEEAIQTGNHEMLAEIDSYVDSLVIWGGEFGFSATGGLGPTRISTTGSLGPTR